MAQTVPCLTPGWHSGEAISELQIKARSAVAQLAMIRTGIEVGVLPWNAVMLFRGVVTKPMAASESAMSINQATGDLWEHDFNPEPIEQVLLRLQPSHHRPILTSLEMIESRLSATIKARVSVVYNCVYSLSGSRQGLPDLMIAFATVINFRAIVLVTNLSHVASFHS